MSLDREDICTVLHEAHKRQGEAALETLSEELESFYE